MRPLIDSARPVRVRIKRPRQYSKEDPMRIHRTLALGAVLLALVVSACTPGGGSTSPSAIESGEINLKPEYLGGMASFLGADVAADPEVTFANMQAKLAEKGLVALDYSPGTDADGFVVRQETADQFNLATMSDLAAVADQLVWGLAPGCPDNPVCGPGLLSTYGIDISQLEVESLPPCSTQMAEALHNSAIDVAQVG